MFQLSIEKTPTVQLRDLIDAVITSGEVIFTQDNLPIAKLVPMPQLRPRPQFGSAKGLFTMADDFDAPLEDMVEYQR